LIGELYEKYSSWEWRFGQSPVFDISYTEKFTWGEVEFQFTQKNGEIIDSKIYTDAMDTELFNGLNLAFIGCKFQINQILEVINKTIKQDEIKNDILNWVNNEF
ncbi:MAG: lipoate--protein ligase, partial [Bacillota bacterium]|nr:lipoate--protein ligase [Bacillota bacterium]